jgi:hypothetical protein
VPRLKSHAAQKPSPTIANEIWLAVIGVRMRTRLIGSEMRRLKRASTPSVGLKTARRSASSAAGTSSCRCTLRS